MEILKIEGCARCKKGDVAIDKDQYGWYEYCIQCGYMRDLKDVVEPKQQADGMKELDGRLGLQSWEVDSNE